MPDKLILTGHVTATKNKQRVDLGPGTDVTEIELPDKTYGLKDTDIERIIRGRAGHIQSAVEEATAEEGTER